MGRRKIAMIEIEEILYRWSKGVSERKISRSLGVSRMTVRKILSQVRHFGVETSREGVNLDQVKASLEGIRKETKSPSPVQDHIKTYHKQIESWLAMPYMTTRQMVRLFAEQNQKISETSLRRYMTRNFPARSFSTVHLETVPGQQSQVDFGFVGLMKHPLNQKLSKAHAFIMTLSHSRYRFVRFVFRQDVKTWIDCHIRAFHFFGGVPETVMCDNLKAGIHKADLYDPVVNLAYGEPERHYGFICDATKVRTPEHKGKIERSIPLVRQQILAGRNFKDIEEANAHALQWCRHEIALRVSRSMGRTPWDLFIEEEKHLLKPLPAQDYECPVWQELKVHRDHHIVFEGSFYSVPTQYIGKKVWVRATERMVEIYEDRQKIKTHVRASTKGQWVTDKQDYPAGARAFLEKDKNYCLEEAQKVGSSTYQLLSQVLQSPALVRLRKAQGILRLQEKYGPKRLEAACQRALSFEVDTYLSLKRILMQDLDKKELSQEQVRVLLPLEATYLRNVEEFQPLNGGVNL